MAQEQRSTFRTQNVDRQLHLQGVQLASFRSRALALLIDALLVVVIILLPKVPAIIKAIESGSNSDLVISTGGLAGVLVAITYFAAATFYGNGATIGKRLLGIKVLSLVHKRLTLWHCIERALGYAASLLEGGFGFVQYFIHANHQTVHDRIAETIVVVAGSAKAYEASGIGNGN
jgi:uncharacterized RDD family membrane protein YckC